MNTIRRMIHGETIRTVGFVLLGFLSLFLFFDVVDELHMVGRVSPLNPADVYGWGQVFAYVLLYVPSHSYELMPIAVLIGTVFVMVRLAQSSEFTVLRTSGLGPVRALRMLLSIGAVLAVLTFVLGDYVAPPSTRTAQLLKARYEGHLTVGQTGAWLREQQDAHAVAVNIRAMDSQGVMQDVRIIGFAPQGGVDTLIEARQAHADAQEAAWWLEEVRIKRLPQTASGQRIVQQEVHERYRWPTQMSADMVAVALLKPERMSTLDLLSYIRHLEANQQLAQRYEIEFWRKLFYPLSCIVMVMLALPFAYLQLRSSGAAGYVFTGVMVGISFFLLNNVFGYLGNLRQWEPWLAAAAPSLMYLLVSLAAFGWLVIRR